MQVFIYRSRRRRETYLYLAQRDDFDPVPPALREAIEPLEFRFEFVLDATRGLAREDPDVVRRNLKDAGFHLQAPRDLVLVDDGASAGGNA